MRKFPENLGKMMSPTVVYLIIADLKTKSCRAMRTQGSRRCCKDQWRQPTATCMLLIDEAELASRAERGCRSEVAPCRRGLRVVHGLT